MSSSANSNSRLLRLADTLLDGTREGRVPWEPTGDPREFSASGVAGTFTVEARDEAGSHPVVLRLFNASGRVVEALQTERGDFYHRWEIRLGELWGEARDVAFNTDALVNDLLDQFGLTLKPPTNEAFGDDDIPF